MAKSSDNSAFEAIHGHFRRICPIHIHCLWTDQCDNSLMRRRRRLALHVLTSLSLAPLLLIVLVMMDRSKGSEIFPSWHRELQWEPDGTGFLSVHWFNYRNEILTNQNVRTIHVNLWIFLGMFCVIPAAWIIMMWLQRRDRRPFNCCKKCGYDLTGNLNGVCSECGTHAGIRWRMLAQFHVERMKGAQFRRPEK
jgi:hypothetical protein